MNQRDTNGSGSVNVLAGRNKPRPFCRWVHATVGAGRRLQAPQPGSCFLANAPAGDLRPS
jgi:hypothetical protein